MKINVRADMGRYIINKDQKKVICILDNTEELFIVFADQNLPISPVCDTLDMTTSKLYSRLRMPKKFIGIATCGPDDEFDPEIGKLIAFSRAKDKLQTSFFKRANYYINILDIWVNAALESINTYGEKLELNTKNRHQKIINIIGEEE